MRSPILITGVPRSGTSMVAGIFSVCGALGGTTIPGNKYNEKGFFENKGIRDNCVKPMLKLLNADPKGQWPLPALSFCNIDFPNGKHIVHSIVRKQGVSDFDYWYYKEPKLALVWRVWYEMFSEAQWILVTRPRGQIRRSVERAPFIKKACVNNFDYWYEYYNDRMLEIAEIPGTIVVDSNTIAKGDYSWMSAVIGMCGLKWNISAVSAFVDSSLYNGG